MVLARDESPVSSWPYSHSRPVAVLSQRGPYCFALGNKGFDAQLAPGGLASTFVSLAQGRAFQGIAVATSQADRAAARLGKWRLGSAEVQMVCLPQIMWELHNNYIANPLLWFVHHGLADQLLAPLDTPTTVRAWKEGYVQVNERLSAAAAALPANPLILVQDYHLFLAPRLLRHSRPDALMAHYLHVPWPEPDSWARLPQYMANALLEGMLAAHLLGFQTRGDARRFLETCSRHWRGGRVDGDSLVSRDGHRTFVGSYPIAVDVSHVLGTALVGERRELWRRIAWPDHMQTIVRVDRLDPTKNLTAGFLAFARLLESQPALQEHVRFVAHLVPSRIDVAEYRAERERIDAVVKTINSRFGNAGWKPIELFLENDRAFAYTLLRRADVVLLNSLADGMNLVAKEAVILNPRVALVLSRKAGAWNELGPWALGIDPTSVEQTAEVLRQALGMSPRQRRQRVSEMTAVIDRQDLNGWFDQQLEDLLKCEQCAAGQRPTDGRLPAHRDSVGIPLSRSSSR